LSRGAAPFVGAVVVLMLTFTGCTSPEPLPPTPIPRAETSVEVVDLTHLPELTAPVACTGYVALTFDDGPTNLTPEILAVLDHYEVPAAFFNTGIQEKAFSRLVEDTVAAGHQLGNHTMNHPDLLTIDLDAALVDIDAATVVHRDLGQDDMTLFRPPYGASSAQLRTAIEGRGMFEVLWTVDSKDYEAETAEQVVEQSKGMVDGGILLLHDGTPVTLEALPQVIEHYYGQDLCFGQVVIGDTELPTSLNGFTHRARASEKDS
jgi:peptidoglycan/xylan/chitin deacetylase (PgdA/CDA1 family)